MERDSSDCISRAIKSNQSVDNSDSCMGSSVFSSCLKNIISIPEIKVFESHWQKEITVTSSTWRKGPFFLVCFSVWYLYDPYKIHSMACAYSFQAGGHLSRIGLKHIWVSVGFFQELPRLDRLLVGWCILKVCSSFIVCCDGNATRNQLSREN